MNCPRCGKPIPANAAFCMHCGLSMATVSVTPSASTLSGTAASPVMARTLEEQMRRRTLVATAAVTFALLLAAIFATKAAGIWGSSGSRTDQKTLIAQGSRPDGAVLHASGSRPSGIMMNGGNRTGSVMSQRATAPEQMPADVYNWLKHLEKCEAQKVALAGDQSAEVTVWMQKNSVLGAGMGMMDPYEQATADGDNDKDPSTYTKGKILDLRPKWTELYNLFRSYPPPPECKPIADDFDRAIVEVPGMMGDLGDILNQTSANPQESLAKLKKMQNSSYGDIDRYFVRCDGKLGDICAKYHMNKWFNIKGDVMAGGIMGKLPFGGG